MKERSSPDLGDFPADLKGLRRWVTWKYETRNGQGTKRPVQAIDDARTWLSVSDACQCVDEGHADGVGFVLGDGIVGIDLDGCITEDGTLHDIARDAIGLGSYAEVSPGGHGLHVLIRARLEMPRKLGKRPGFPGREVYDGRKGCARYFTVTGNRLGDARQLASGSQAQAALDNLHPKMVPERTTTRRT